MRDLTPRAAPALAIAENATTPSAPLGAEIWSTTEGAPLAWDGDQWAPSDAASALGDVVGPGSAVAGGAASFPDATGKTIADAGRPVRPELQVLTADLPSVTPNTTLDVFTHVVEPGETVAISVVLAYQMSVSAVGAGIGFRVESGSPTRVGASMYLQNKGTNSSNTAISQGDVFGQSGGAESQANVTDASAYSTTQNIGYRAHGVFKNTGESALTVRLFQTSIGNGTVTIKAGSMSVAYRM